MDVDIRFRVVYIVTPAGEIGPHRVEELSGLLADAAIAPDDHVRTAFGVRVGTVDDILSGRVKIGSDAVNTHRDEGSGPREATGRKRLMPLLGTLAAVAGLLVLGWLLLRPAPEMRVAAPRDAILPAVSLRREADDAAGAVVRVVLDRRVATPVTVFTAIAPGEAGVFVAPKDGIVVIAPGEDSATLTLARRGDAYRARTFKLVVVPAATYRQPVTAELALTLPPAAAPAIAWESFAPPVSGQVAASGWVEPEWTWRSGAGLVRVGTALLVPGFAAPPYHGRLEAGAQQWCGATRRLTQTIDQGTVWMSFLVEFLPQAGGALPWAGIALRHAEREVLAVGAYTDDTAALRLGLIATQEHLDDRTAINRPCPATGLALVVRLDLHPAGGSAMVWVAPGRTAEPRPGDSLLHLPAFPPIRFDEVQLGALNASGMRIAHLRIGRSWSEAMPAE